MTVPLGSRDLSVCSGTVVAVRNSSAERSLGRTVLAPPPVQLVNWPLRDGGLRVWLWLVMLVGAAVVSGGLSRSTSMGAAIFAILIACSWRLWVPVQFEIGSKGITQTVLGHRSRIPWSAIARCDLRQSGVLFLADTAPSAFGVFRGTYVAWNGQREALLNVVEFFLKPGERGR